MQMPPQKLRHRELRAEQWIEFFQRTSGRTLCADKGQKPMRVRGNAHPVHSKVWTEQAQNCIMRYIQEPNGYAGDVLSRGSRPPKSRGFDKPRRRRREIRLLTRRAINVFVF